MSDPHGTQRTACARTSCKKPGVILDDRGSLWCPAEYALIFAAGDRLERFLCAAAATLARLGRPLPQPA